jgi:hypothetical protein
MKLRLTKTQKAYQEQVIATYGLADQFKPSRYLVGELAVEVKVLKDKRASLICQLAAEKNKSLFTRIRERIFTVNHDLEHDLEQFEQAEVIRKTIEGSISNG